MSKKDEKNKEAMEEKAEGKVEKKATEKKTTKKATKKTEPKNKAKENVEKIAKAASTPKATRKQRDMNELVSVICITNRPLVYESKSQVGYRIEWGGFLEENWMEYKELINMRNSQRAFFTEPWVICDWDVLVDLRVDSYYKNIIDLENLDELFQKSPENLEETLKIVPKGVRQLILDRAFELRREGRLDSISIIDTIEKTLNVDLSI